jgi:hypothetical protein
MTSLAFFIIKDSVVILVILIILLLRNPYIVYQYNKYFTQYYLETSYIINFN